MKFRLFLIFCCIAAITPGAVFAQTNAAALTSGGAARVGGGSLTTALSTNSMEGLPLAGNLNFGDVSPNIGGRRVITIPIRVSATTNYKIELARVAAANGAFDPKNVLLSVGNARPRTSINPKLAPNATNLDVSGCFGRGLLETNNFKAAQCQTSLADVSENPTVVLIGAPTVAGGVLNEDDNSILIDLTFVIAARYYAPVDAAQINLTINIVPLL